MLKRLEYTGQPAEAQRVVTGQWLGKAKLDAHQRAELAAKWVSRKIEVKPTVKAAVVIFGVSQPLISAALADLKAPARRKKNGNGNGSLSKATVIKTNGGNGNGDYDVVVHDYAKLPFIPDINDIWSHLSDDERADFVSAHLAGVWEALEAVT
jgi:hypothetical protein